MFYKCSFIFVFHLILSTGNSFAQIPAAQNSLAEETFSGVKKLISVFEAGANEEAVLVGMRVYNYVPTIYEGRSDDYYTVAQKISQLKEILPQKIKTLQSKLDTRPKDAFETSEQYRQRQLLFEQQLRQQYMQDVAPFEAEINQWLKRYYRSNESSELNFNLVVEAYNADRSIWNVKVTYKNFNSLLSLNIKPELAKEIWENRSLLTIQDVTNLYGELKYTEIGISEIGWKIFIEYTYSQVATSQSTQSSKSLSLIPGMQTKQAPAKNAVSNNLQETVVNAPLIEDESENLVFSKVEVEAQFPGGDASLSRFVQREVEKRIDELTDDGRSGTCEVQFIVDREGNVSNVEAITMKGTKLAEVAVNAIRKGPKWVPAIQNGRQVRAWRRQKITFGRPLPD